MSDPLYNLNGRIVSLDDMKAREAAYWEKWRATRPDLDKTALSPVALKKLELLKREYAYRQIQALKLYEPLPIQKQFHECRSPERIIIGGNRGTKTMCCAAEIAMAVTGTHRYGGKYPKEGGRVICVAKDGIKIGEVFYQKLFMPGAFSMVKDAETGIYRAWRPWTDGWDVPRRKALPLIPKRMIKAIAWEDKKLNQPKKVTLVNGWDLLFFTSAGKPMEGIDVDICLAGWSEIFDPVAKVYKRVEEINGHFHVWSYNEKLKRTEIRHATKPFIKGFGEIVKVSMSNGECMFTTRQHRVLTTNGNYVSVSEALSQALPLAVPGTLSPRALQGDAELRLGSCRTGKRFAPYSVSNKAQQDHLAVAAVETCTKTFASCGDVYGLREISSELDYRDDCSPCSRRRGELLPSRQACDPASVPSREHAVEYSPSRLLSDDLDALQGGIPARREQTADVVLSSCVHAARMAASTHSPETERGEQSRLHYSSQRQSPRSSCRGQRTSDAQVRDQGLVSSSQSPVFITDIKHVRNDTIWDISVEGNKNYLYAGVFSHNCWFDEEIYEKSTLGSWYDEMAARLIDRSGMFIWSATPQGATQQLSDLNDRAEEEKNDPEPRIAAFHVTLDDNPFLPEKAKDLFRHKASFDPDEYRVRVLGEFLLSSQLVYPNFRKSTHCIEPFAVPPNWCRYLVVDPGFANVVGLFFAVPPPTADPNIRDHVYVYDEVYGHQWDAKKFVERLYPKMHGQVFQSFIIDRHGSIRTESSGMTVGEQYAEQMRVRGLRSIETGSDFHAIGDSGSQASSPVKMGVSQVRSWLWERDEFGGTAKLQVFAHCEEFIREMSKYRNKIDKGKATDIPDNKRFSHGPDALRYAVLHGLAYVQPGKPKKRLKGLVKYLRNIAKAERKQDGDYVLLGPTYSRR